MFVLLVLLPVLAVTCVALPPQDTHRRHNGQRAAGDFVFPEKPMNFTPKQNVDNCSEDGTKLCVKNVENYPYRHIEQVLGNLALDYRSYFTTDKEDVNTRIENIEEQPACQSEETIIYPKIGQNADDQFLFIVNDDKNYKQGIKVEKCGKKEGSPCASSLVVPTGYRTVCKQKFIYRKLLAIGPNGDPVPDSFKVPSCCSCHILKEYTSNFRSLLPGKNITPRNIVQKGTVMK